MTEIDRSAAEQEATAQNAEQHGESVGEGVPEETPTKSHKEQVDEALRVLARTEQETEGAVGVVAEARLESFTWEGSTLVARFTNFDARHIAEGNVAGSDASGVFYEGVDLKAALMVAKPNYKSSMPLSQATGEPGLGV